jgi:TetR/AcrR family transcriptional repressor of nem operon
MARTREFDIDHAVERAMELFWQQGFEATSVADLTRELGIGKGSLYAAFGSKEELYAAALGRYCSSHAAGLVALLDEASEIRPALRTALRAMAEADAADPTRGCLLVNAATERGDDPATVDTVDRTMRLVESALTGALERARARGELAAGKDPAALARFLTTFVQGLRVMGKARATPAVIDDAMEVALATLD